ncbi:MAG: hypothetical protein ACR2I8_06450, partial [Steroidobacteraceae bacterium]
CFGALNDGKTHLYVFNWSEIEAIVKGAKWVGLAFPMDGDRFKVVRFSLNGIDGSTRFLETAFKQGLDASGTRPQGTRTQVM